MKIFACYISAMAIIASLVAGENPAPTLDLEISNCLQGESNGCAVSNLKRIQLLVALQSNGHSFSKRLADCKVNPSLNSPETPDHYIAVTVVDAATGQQRSIIASVVGSERSESGGDTVVLSLLVPEDAAVRRAKIQSFIDQAKAKARNEGGAQGQSMANEMAEKNEAALQSMDRYWIENKVGRYKVSASYVSNAPNAWSGETSSPSVDFEVIDLGSPLTPKSN